MDKLVDFVSEKNADQFRDAFLERISDKVVNCLETEKTLIAQKFFSDVTDVDSVYPEAE